MQIIIVYDNEKEKPRADATKVEIENKYNKKFPVNTATNEMIRDEDIVNYFYWKFTKENRE